jgi:hypothetical protein
MKFSYFLIGFGIVNIVVGLWGWQYNPALLLSGSSLILLGWSGRNKLHSPFRRHPSLLDPRD